MEFFIKAAQLITSLAILVVLHELGHYLAARMFKIKVEKFYLFFNPYFSLYKKKIGDTEWGIGWLPLGGYVKIAGMIDESMDKEQMAKPAQPWEFRSKPAWQRLIVMIGGVVVNLIVGIVIYIFSLSHYGAEKVHMSQLDHGLGIHTSLNKYGLKSGDNILAINGVPTTHINDINNGILLRDHRVLDVLHADGSKEVITLPEGIEYTLFEQGAFPPITLRADAIINEVSSSGIAEKAGLEAKDVIVSINGKEVLFDNIRSEFEANKGKDAVVEVKRGKEIIKKTVSVSDKGTIGIVYNMNSFLDSDQIFTEHYSFGQSIVNGWDKGFTTLGDYVGQMKFIFTKKGASSVGGFASMGKMYAPTWDWQVFWSATALISIILAFMNILPIPALDGGHVVFLLYEMIRGKEAPQKILEYAQYVGVLFFIALMLYANGNDIYKAIFN